MKTAKAFLVGMYAHLLLIVVIPVGILTVFEGKSWNMSGSGLLIVYMLAVVVVQTLGWGMAGMAILAYGRGEIEKIRKGWKLLKFGSIPFYILNFVYGCAAYLAAVGGSRGLMIFLVPVPLLVTCLMIVQSGCVGVCCIMHLRKHPEKNTGPHGIHYVLQLLPVLDVISTFVILKK